MNALTTGTLVSSAEVEPLYPATRLLAAEAVDLEQALERERELLVEARARSDALREEAKREAQSVIAAAQAEAADVRARATEDGRREGRAEIAAVLSRLDEEVREVGNAIGLEVQRLACRFAAAVLDVEFAVRPHRIVELVTKVLENAALYRDIRIHLHPGDVPIVTAELSRLEAHTPLVQSLRVVEDPEASPHSVRIETEMGSFWGGVEEHLAGLRSHLGLDGEDGS